MMKQKKSHAFNILTLTIHTDGLIATTFSEWI